jgi:hypothetical protein
MKIRPVAAELFHADGRTDGQTDKMKLMVAFRNFAKAPKRLKSIRKRHRAPVVLNAAFFRVMSPHFII